MTEQQEKDFPPGIAMIHSNRMEDLRGLLLEWVKNNPLPPFEKETILLQSNGIRQWLKLGFAETEVLGISADIDFLLPSPFIWECYRSLLSDINITTQSSLDRGPLTWRLYQMMLKTFESDPDRYESLTRFLNDKPHPIKRYQLSTQLADLFDQYQVHRADWLLDWSIPSSELQDRLRKTPNQISSLEIPSDLHWQPSLWRALIEDLGDADWAANSRSTLHLSLLERIEAIERGEYERPISLPRRIIVFGISSLPRQTLETLGYLGKISQVVVFVHNPCQHYWGNIIEGTDLLKSDRFHYKSQGHKSASNEDLHLFGNPLLAAWGKQGRDFVRLLDDWDDLAYAKELFKNDINHFTDTEEAAKTLLEKVQWGIVNLDETPAETSPITADDSLSFHVAHSPQREVEILHDQLLRLFDQNDKDHTDIQPRDVIVMLPDVDQYAPHIDAVFGRREPREGEDAPPLIPYSIADRKNRGHNPIYKALEILLKLPDSRFSASEILDLLDVEAIQKRFGLKPQNIPTLQRWIRDAGIRWGLDLDHRLEGNHLPSLDQDIGLNQNTWAFGLDRLFLGYAMADGEPFADIAPFSGIGGIESSILGSLHALIKALKNSAIELSQDATPKIWGDRFSGLLLTYFLAESPADERSLSQLRDSLESWLKECGADTFETPLPLIVAREAWTSKFDQPNLTQRFLSGNVHFCTLMPMRSIPFKVVCLMGMNAGDYPRQQPPRAFDLMQQPGAYRPGDRSRRDDDRYMFLEALLSARKKLLISWVGRSIRDNSELEASVLVNQLKDHLAACWHLEDSSNTKGSKLLDALTTVYPMQAFSRRYLEPSESTSNPLFTYAREWLKATAKDHEEALDAEEAIPLPDVIESLSIAGLSRFLRNPVEHFFNRRLNVYFDRGEAQIEDDENFALNALQGYQIKARTLEVDASDTLESTLDATLKRLRLEGQFPMAASGDLLSDQIRTTALHVIQQEWAFRQGWNPEKMEPLDLKPLSFTTVSGHTLTLEDSLENLYAHGTDPGRYVTFKRVPSDILNTKSAPRLDKALDLWITQLAANASGLRLASYLIGSDGVVYFPAIEDPSVAHSHLSLIVNGWLEGLKAPLPVAPQTGLAFLYAKEGSEDKNARSKYEGGYKVMGEAEKSPYLQRAFPTYADLRKAIVSGKGFSEWIEDLYAPLRHHILASGEEE
jgi:exodeoxyribonuclease V gamma subunit